jgi:hypothetical protein
VFDAVRVRLIEIGEAVTAIEPALLDAEPGVPWHDIAGMCDHLRIATSTPTPRSSRPPSIRSSSAPSLEWLVSSPTLAERAR